MTGAAATGLAITMASNGQRTAHKAQPVQPAASAKVLRLRP